MESVSTMRLPMATLGHQHLKLADKVMAMLWMVWLVAGPTKAGLQAYVDSVRMIVTDWGTESGIQDAPDVLDIFFEFLQTGKVRYSAIVPGSRLFKNAVFCPG